MAKQELDEIWKDFLAFAGSDIGKFYEFVEKFCEAYGNTPADDRRLHLNNLPERFLTALSGQLQNQRAVKLMNDLQILRAKAIIDCLAILSKNKENLALIASLSFVPKLYQMTATLFTQSFTDAQSDLIQSFLLFLSRLYDPYNAWQLVQRSGESLRMENQHEPPLLDNVIVSMICGAFDSPHLNLDTKYQLVELLGRILSGCQRNALKATCPLILETMKTILQRDNMSVLMTPLGLRRNILTCFTLMVKTLHNAGLEERQVEMEVGCVLEAYFEVIDQLQSYPAMTRRQPELHASLFDTLRDMIDGQKDLLGLQAAFISVNTFTKIVSFLESIQADPSLDYTPLTKSVIETLHSLLLRSSRAKANFLQTVGYERLLLTLQALGQPKQTLLESLLVLAVENKYDRSLMAHRIVNPHVILLLVKWLPSIDDLDLRLWLVKAVKKMCCETEMNKMTCCEHDVIMMAAKSLQEESMARSSNTADQLINLIEKLGILSISAAETKQLISLLKQQDAGYQFPYCGRVISALTSMAEKQNSQRTYHYFSLPAPTSGLDIPGDRRADLLSTGFTVNMWLSLDQSYHITHTRRVLYSFHTPSGGFEAYIYDRQLYVALCKDNQYSVVPVVTRCAVDDGQWHMISVVHSVSTLRAKWKVTVCVDGKRQFHCDNFGTLSLSGALSYRVGGPCHSSGQVIGASAEPSSPTKQMVADPWVIINKLQTLTGKLLTNTHRSNDGIIRGDSGSQDEVFGLPVGIHGNIGYVCLLKKHINDDQVLLLYNKGVNALDLFRDAKELESLQSSVVFHFHAKMCSGDRCIDLSPNSKDGTLTEGHICSTHSLKDMIQCIGGVQVFIPILDQVKDLSNESDKILGAERSQKSKCCTNPVVGLFNLLRSVIKDNKRNQENLLMTNSLQTIGALLQQVDRSVMTEEAFMAVDLFLHALDGRELINAALCYLFFDFRVWKNTSTVVKVAQAQFLSNTIATDKQTLAFFRKNFGVQFLLDSLRQFYSDVLADVESCSDIGAIQSCLFSMLKFLVRGGITKEELLAIISFILSVADYKLVGQAISLLSDLLNGSNDQIHLKMYERDAAVLLYDLLVLRTNQAPRINGTTGEIPSHIKQSISQLLAKLAATSKVQEKSKSLLRMEEFSMRGLLKQIQSLTSEESTIVLCLLDIVCQPETRELHYDNVLAVVSFTQNMSVSVKLQVARKVLSIMHIKTTAAAKMSEVTGWQRNIITLLMRGDYSSPYGEPVFVVESPSPADDFVMVDNPVNMSSVFLHDPSFSSLPESRTSASSFTGRESATFDLEVSSSSISGSFSTNFEDDADYDDDTLVEKLMNAVLDMHHKIMWSGLTGNSDHVWKERIKVFISMPIRNEELLVGLSSVVYQRKLLEKLLQSCYEEINDVVPADANGARNGLWLMKMVMHFTQKCSEELHDEGFSEELLDIMLQLLENKMTVWHSTSGWEELANIGLKILLMYSSRRSVNLCTNASAKIHHLVRDHSVTNRSEICYMINSLNQKLNHTLIDLDDDHFMYSSVLQIMRPILEQHGDEFDVNRQLPGLPSLNSNPNVEAQCRFYFSTNEWQRFIEEVIVPGMSHHIRKMRDIESDMLNHWTEAEQDYNVDIHRVNNETGESKLKFQAEVEEPAREKREADKRGYNTRLTLQSRKLAQIMRQWQDKMQFFSSQRGTWSNIGSDEVHWMMSTHENFSRMRLKMVPNLHFDLHTEASRMRDLDSSQETADEPSSLSLPAPSGDFDVTVDDDTESSQIETVPPVVEEPLIEEKDRKERLLIQVDCSRISQMDPINGRLEITTNNIYFFDTEQQPDQIGADFKFSLKMLRDVHCRLRSLQRTALEFFLIDQTNYFLNFTTENRKEVLKVIQRAKRGDAMFKIFGNIRKRADMLKAAKLTTKWRRWEISNFDYIMELNTIAGRSYNDWSQYPVFPWVLQDFGLEELNLADDTIYRDFSRPITAQSEDTIEDLQIKYELMKSDETSGMVPFHHGQHYLPAATVIHYLVRMEPFATAHIDLQSNTDDRSGIKTRKFDLADRQLYSLSQASKCRPADKKEATPEFYCLPEFLVNMNGYDLGYLKHTAENGQPVKVDDVKLPSWASSADEFIWLHRKALESEYVSSHLHEWIDLIFGYKQRGPAAAEACNVYHAATYEGAYDLSSMNPSERENIEKMINDFGQTPCQLLKEPHPSKMRFEECIQTLVNENKAVSLLHFLRRAAPNDHPLRSYQISLYEKDKKEPPGCIITACVPHHQTINPIGPIHETLVSISDKGIVGLHQWLAYDSGITNKFTLTKDHSVDQPKQRKIIRGPFLPGINLEPMLFAVSHDAEVIYCGGYWDNSLAIYTPKRNTVKRIKNCHTEVVTCVALDPSGEYLMSGSRDTTCKIWVITHQDIQDKPSQSLYGHDGEVLTVAISSEYDMAVSGSKDGTINIHTVQGGLFVRTLRPPSSQANVPFIISQVALSYLGHIVAYTEEGDSAQTGRVCRHLHLFSLNGRHLSKRTVGGRISQIVLAQEFILYGDSKGHLNIFELYGFKEVAQLPMKAPIKSVSMTKGHTHILVGLDGEPSKLIVVVRNADPELRMSRLIP